MGLKRREFLIREWLNVWHSNVWKEWGEEVLQEKSITKFL